MKQLLLLILTLTFLSINYNLDAQKRKTVVYKNGRKTIVKTRRNGSKTIVHKSKLGRKTVIHKGKKNKTHILKTRRTRVRRTLVVHHHYRHLPRRGAIVTTVNPLSLTIRHRGIGFRFHSGVWYKPRGRKWVVVRPPLGVRVGVLPPQHRVVLVGTNRYYYFYGTYYVQKNNEYEVVNAPLYAEVDSIPDGYDTVTVEGEKYYGLDDTFYMPSADDEGKEILVVVENPNK